MNATYHTVIFQIGNSMNVFLHVTCSFVTFGAATFPHTFLLVQYNSFNLPSFTSGLFFHRCESHCHCFPLPLPPPPPPSVAVSAEQTAWSKRRMGNDVSSLRQSLRGTFTIPLSELSRPPRSQRANQSRTARGVSLCIFPPPARSLNS